MGMLLRTAAAAALAAAAEGALMNSAWPIVHHDASCSDFATSRGPQGAAGLQHELKVGVGNLTSLQLADPISLVFEADNETFWGSSVSGVFKLRAGRDGGLETVDYHFRDYNFDFHGAYAMLLDDGSYLASARKTVQSYRAVGGSIEMVAEVEVPGMRDDEHIIGLSYSHRDGWLVYATSRGRVGAVTRDLTSRVGDVLQLPFSDRVALPAHMISNSFAMDREGGAYIVTSMALHRVAFDAATMEPSLDWTFQYSDGQDPWMIGRLGPGAGSSPTVVDDPGSGRPRHVLFTDGGSPMTLYFVDARSGDALASELITFGGRSESTSEQSVVAGPGGCALVVNNYVVDKVGRFCEAFSTFPYFNDVLKMTCPLLFGWFATGAQQVCLDWTGSGPRAVTTWVNEDVSCTSSIPVVAADGIAYCLGKRAAGHGPNPVGRAGEFTLEALDWATGESIFSHALGRSIAWNSNYAGTEVGSDGEVIMGTLGGVLRVREGGRPAAAGAAARAREPIFEADVARADAEFLRERLIARGLAYGAPRRQVEEDVDWLLALLADADAEAQAPLRQS